MMFLLFLFLFISSFSSSSSLCPDTSTCIENIRQIVAAPRRFWFGEQRRVLCDHRDSSSSIDCYGPSDLSSFHSIGSRLFRAKTYHSAYLANLEIFPRITYRAAPGRYRACEHDFHVSNVSVIEADPDMEPIDPFLIRRKPEIHWPGLQYDEEYTILMTDVGFGTLNYLVTGFPKNPKVLREYEPCENFRPLANPLVLLVFRGGGDISIPDGDSFHLNQFMINNELADHLIGLSIVVVGSDAFAIERQRIRGSIDNCHSLIRSKLARHPSFPLLSTLATEELDSWLSVSYHQPHLEANVCCQKIRQRSKTLFLDPLGDESISAASTIYPPTVSSLRLPVERTPYLNYHRQARTYVALMDSSLYSLIIVNGISGHLHWMIVDIPSADLSNLAFSNPITKSSYDGLIPSKAASCTPFLFALLSQSSSLSDIPLYTEEKKRTFQLNEFKQQNALKLSAITWTNSCYDLPYAFHILIKHQNGTDSKSRKSKKDHHSKLLSTEICTSFKVSPHHSCSVSSTSSYSIFSSLYISLIILYYSLAK